MITHAHQHPSETDLETVARGLDNHVHRAVEWELPQPVLAAFLDQPESSFAYVVEVHVDRSAWQYGPAQALNYLAGLLRHDWQSASLAYPEVADANCLGLALLYQPEPGLRHVLVVTRTGSTLWRVRVRGQQPSVRFNSVTGAGDPPTGDVIAALRSTVAAVMHGHTNTRN